MASAKPAVLIPAAALPRIADALAALPHNFDTLLWDAGTITDVDGEPAQDPQPVAAWISIELMLSGDRMEFAESIAAMPSIQWAQSPTAGFDAPYCQVVIDAGKRFSNSDAPNVGVAEFVLSAVLSHSHGIAKRIELQKAKKWNQALWPEINGQRWAIVGFGSIGREIAKRARPFGVEVVGVRRSKIDDAAADEMATMDNLHDVLGTADTVILACPLTEQTEGLVDEQFLAAMAPHAVLVNIARGPVVNHDALVAALDAGTISHAILDVLDPEPHPEDSPLWAHEKLTITSHVAGAGMGFFPRNAALFVEQLDNFLADRPLRMEVTG